MDFSKFNVDQDLFSGKKNGEILTLSFRENPLLHITDLSAKKALFDYLELVACCNQIKVLLLKESPTKMNRTEYVAFYQNMIEPGIMQTSLERMYNAISQLVLKLVSLNKMVVHADSGNVILLFMNISLACDYRIVADDTVFENPNFELGVVPKGGSSFFLSKMLGTTTASKILLCGRDISAAEAFRLGIVDKVVPLKKIDQAALEKARLYAQIPTNYAVGVKKLINNDLKELACFLEFENGLLREQVRSCKKQTA